MVSSVLSGADRSSLLPCKPKVVVNRDSFAKKYGNSKAGLFLMLAKALPLLSREEWAYIQSGFYSKPDFTGCDSVRSKTYSLPSLADLSRQLWAKIKQNKSLYAQLKSGHPLSRNFLKQLMCFVGIHIDACKISKPIIVSSVVAHILINHLKVVFVFDPQSIRPPVKKRRRYHRASCVSIAPKIVTRPKRHSVDRRVLTAAGPLVLVGTAAFLPSAAAELLEDGSAVAMTGDSDGRGVASSRLGLLDLPGELDAGVPGDEGAATSSEFMDSAAIFEEALKIEPQKGKPGTKSGFIVALKDEAGVVDYVKGGAEAVANWVSSWFVPSKTAHLRGTQLPPEPRHLDSNATDSGSVAFDFSALFPPLGEADGVAVIVGSDLCTTPSCAVRRILNVDFSMLDDHPGVTLPIALNAPEVMDRISLYVFHGVQTAAVSSDSWFKYLRIEMSSGRYCGGFQLRPTDGPLSAVMIADTPDSVTSLVSTSTQLLLAQENPSVAFRAPLASTIALPSAYGGTDARVSSIISSRSFADLDGLSTRLGAISKSIKDARDAVLGDIGSTYDSASGFCPAPLSRISQQLINCRSALGVLRGTDYSLEHFVQNAFSDRLGAEGVGTRVSAMARNAYDMADYQVSLFAASKAALRAQYSSQYAALRDAGFVGLPALPTFNSDALVRMAPPSIEEILLTNGAHIADAVTDTFMAFQQQFARVMVNPRITGLDSLQIAHFQAFNLVDADGRIPNVSDAVIATSIEAYQREYGEDGLAVYTHFRAQFNAQRAQGVQAIIAEFEAAIARITDQIADFQGLVTRDGSALESVYRRWVSDIVEGVQARADDFDTAMAAAVSVINQLGPLNQLATRVMGYGIDISSVFDSISGVSSWADVLRNYGALSEDDISQIQTGLTQLVSSVGADQIIAYLPSLNWGDFKALCTADGCDLSNVQFPGLLNVLKAEVTESSDLARIVAAWQAQRSVLSSAAADLVISGISSLNWADFQAFCTADGCDLSSIQFPGQRSTLGEEVTSADDLLRIKRAWSTRMQTIETVLASSSAELAGNMTAALADMTTAELGRVQYQLGQIPLPPVVDHPFETELDNAIHNVGVHIRLSTIINRNNIQSFTDAGLVAAGITTSDAARILLQSLNAEIAQFILTDPVYPGRTQLDHFLTTVLQPYIERLETEEAEQVRIAAEIEAERAAEADRRQNALAARLRRQEAAEELRNNIILAVVLSVSSLAIALVTGVVVQRRRQLFAQSNQWQERLGNATMAALVEIEREIAAQWDHYDKWHCMTSLDATVLMFIDRIEFMLNAEADYRVLEAWDFHFSELYQPRYEGLLADKIAELKGVEDAQRAAELAEAQAREAAYQAALLAVDAMSVSELLAQYHEWVATPPDRADDMLVRWNEVMDRHGEPGINVYVDRLSMADALELLTVVTSCCQIQASKSIFIAAIEAKKATFFAQCERNRERIDEHVAHFSGGFEAVKGDDFGMAVVLREFDDAFKEFGRIFIEGSVYVMLGSEAAVFPLKESDLDDFRQRIKAVIHKDDVDANMALRKTLHDSPELWRQFQDLEVVTVFGESYRIYNGQIMSDNSWLAMCFLVREVIEPTPEEMDYIQRIRQCRSLRGLVHKSESVALTTDRVRSVFHWRKKVLEQMLPLGIHLSDEPLRFRAPSLPLPGAWQHFVAHTGIELSKVFIGGETRPFSLVPVQDMDLIRETLGRDAMSEFNKILGGSTGYPRVYAILDPGRAGKYGVRSTEFEMNGVDVGHKVAVHGSSTEAISNILAVGIDPNRAERTVLGEGFYTSTIFDDYSYFCGQAVYGDDSRRGFLVLGVQYDRKKVREVTPDTKEAYFGDTDIRVGVDTRRVSQGRHVGIDRSGYVILRLTRPELAYPHFLVVQNAGDVEYSLDDIDAMDARLRARGDCRTCVKPGDWRFFREEPGDESADLDLTLLPEGALPAPSVHLEDIAVEA